MGALESNSLIARLKKRAHQLLQEIELIEAGQLEYKPQHGHKIDLFEEVRKFEISLIVNALTRTNGVQKEAAHLLGINTSTLHWKLKQFGIKIERFK